MSNIVQMRQTTPVAELYNSKAIALIRRTVAADTNDDEFSMFIHMARALKLDPLRRQIYAFVYNKDRPEKRRMTIITGIDGFRAIAERTGNYRPDEDEPSYEMDASLKGPNNPAGLVKATVRVWKFAHGDWHKVTASAYWDEYAPLKDEWVFDEAQGRRKPSGKLTLDTSGNWGKMPRLMLAKVAEALALRKAWPDDFANVYASEEMDRAKASEMSPAELASQADVDARLERLGGPSILIDWMDQSKDLVSVPVGVFADRCMSFLDQHAEQPAAVAMWRQRNREALRQFWAQNKTDALSVNARIEAIVGSVR